MIRYDHRQRYLSAVEVLAAWYKRGDVLCQLGRYEEAILFYDKALEIKPDDPTYRIFRIIAMDKLKQ
jgi:tetratricopeptide (TPR) repeat protein